MKILLFVVFSFLLLNSCSDQVWLTNEDVEKRNQSSTGLINVIGEPLTKKPATLQGPVNTTEYIYVVVTKSGELSDRVYYYRSDDGSLERFTLPYSGFADPKFRVLKYTDQHDRKLIEDHIRDHPYLIQRDLGLE